MVPSFNTAGPCVPGEHYLLPPERRLEQIMLLIEERKFFTLHAGNQIGKTTCARWLVKRRSWKQKLFIKKRKRGGRIVHLVGG